jgi:hypothetical protein
LPPAGRCQTLSLGPPRCPALFEKSFGLATLAKFPTGRRTTTVASIIEDGRGFIAVGWGGRESRGRLWTSPDGQRWTAQPDGQFSGHLLRKIVRAGNDLYIFGRDRRGTRLWHSTDGRSWTQLAESPELVGGGINDVAVSGGTMIAAGFTEEPDYQGAIWRSTDGLDWQRLPSPTGLDELQAIAARGNTLVGFGSYPYWRGPLIVYSTDLGDSWQAAEMDAAIGEAGEPGGLVGLAVNADRFVAVGYIAVEAPYDPRPLALTSANGRSWTSVVLNSSGYELLENVIALRGGFLGLGTLHSYAIGECRPRACIFDDQVGRAHTSADGRNWVDAPSFYEDGREWLSGDTVGDVTHRVAAASGSGVLIAQEWNDSVRVWFAPNSLFR